MVFASNNKGKLKEIRSILGDDVKSLEDVFIDVEVLEDGETFYDNALKKAKEIYELCHEEVIADDSGLCIDYLDGFPGVTTARFLGEDATSEDRNKYIIDKLDGISNRKCQVVCELVYYDGERVISSKGIIDGTITLSPRGENGFGFDPIVELLDGRTLAELSSEEKNKISARYLAVKQLKSMI